MVHDAKIVIAGPKKLFVMVSAVVKERNLYNDDICASHAAVRFRKLRDFQAGTLIQM